MYKTLKIPFKHIIKENNTKNIIEDLILRTTKIIKHTYYFIKLFTIDNFENNKSNVFLDKEKIRFIYSLISTIKSKQTVKYENKEIKKFYDDIYSKINIQKESRDGLTNILAYEADLIITCIENNIKNNFTRHFNTYIYHTFELKNKLENINNIEDKKTLWGDFRSIKTDILSFEKYKSDEKYHAFIKEQQLYLFNKSFQDNIKNTHILYEVKSSPQTFLFTFYKILQKYEILNSHKVENKIRLFSVLPLRRSLIPKHITLDSEILIQNFKDKIKANLHKFPEEITNIEDLRRNFMKHQKELWSIFFNLDKAKINKNYEFDYLIKTDNIACSMQFVIKRNEGEIKGRFKKGENKKIANKSNNVIKKSHKNVKYIDDILANNRFALNAKKIACIDPNKSDLIYCGTYKDNELVTFRYTNNQRRKESKRKKYSNIRRKILNTKKAENKGKNETMTKIESEKSNICLNEIKKKKIIENLKITEEIDKKIEKSYIEPLFRKLNMNAYINIQRSESRMIKNFSKKIGSKEDTIVIIGDNGIKDVIVKGLESTISKRIIEIFKRFNYEVYIIDEYNTSALCNGCSGKLSKFLEVKSKKPRTKGKKFMSHGILRCQSSAQRCNVIHNRDKNAVKNMLKIVSNYQLSGKRIKQYLRNSV